MFTAAAWAGKSYSTNFPLTESPISEAGAWSNVGLDWSNVLTSGNLAVNTQTGSGGFDDAYAHLTGFGTNHRASGTVHVDAGISGSTTHEVEIHLRWFDSAHLARGYECTFAFDGSYVQVVRWNGAKSSFTYIAGPGGTSGPGGTLGRALQTGDVVSAQVSGSTITTYWNGALIVTCSDTMWVDGNPGMGLWRGAPSSPQNDLSFSSYSAVTL